MTETTLADLKPDPRNARKHNPRNIGMIVDSLHQVGAARSIVIDEDNVILAGNGVIEAAAEAGIMNVRIIEASGNEIIAVKRTGLTPEQKTKLALFDNRTAELADWDVDVLGALDLDLGDMFFDSELAEMGIGLDEPTEDPGPQIDKAAELQEKWGTARGQVWEIGKHRLMCGDSTSAEDVGRLMGGEKADGIVTDPPFNVGFEYAGEYKGQDNKTSDEYGVFLTSALTLAEDALTPGAFVFVWQAATNVRNFTRWFMGRDWRILAAAKGMVQFLPTPVQYSWDPVVFWNIKGNCPIKPVAGKRDWYLSNTASWLQDSVEGHPCPRPLDAVSYVADEFIVSGGVIIDPFLGSGTTMVAAEQTGRICYGMEIEPKYCAVTLERMAGMGLEPQLS